MSDFRSWMNWPPEARDAIEAGTFTVKEIQLLSIIERLSYQKGFCYAGNDYIKSIIKTNNRYLMTMISKLVKLGLVNRWKDENNKRCLQISWYDLSTIRGDVTEFPRDEKTSSLTKKPRDEKTSPPESPKGDSLNKIKGGRFSIAPANATNLETLGFVESDPVKDYFHNLSLDYRHAIRKHHPSRQTAWKPSIQAKVLAKLCKDVGRETFDKVFNWYMDHLPDAKTKKLPIAGSPSQLSKHWNWIVDVMERDCVADSIHDVEVTPLGQKLAGSFKNVTIDGLEEIASEVLTLYGDFMEWACDHYPIINKHYDNTLPGFYAYGLNWMKKVEDTFEYTKGRCKVENLRFSFEHKDFQRLMKKYGFSKDGLAEAVERFTNEN